MTPIAGWNAGAAACATDGVKLYPSIRQGGDCIVEASFQTITIAVAATIAAAAIPRQRQS
ncbi:MAG TPA: hypothetical protein VNR65_07515 [Geobacterales bacterium]|nr:hypothetical protein [Geobacterales bacterium]